MPAAQRSARTRRPRQSRSRLVALLILGPLLCVIALTGLAYVGLTQQTQRDTLTRVGLAAQAARGAALANIGELKVTNGQLTSALPANVTALNNNSAEVQRLRSQVGVDVLIAQHEQNAFVVVASSLAPAHKSASPAGLGERLSGVIASKACATSSATTTGALTIAGADYLAGSVPLVDGSGACVGALIALMPQSALQSVALQYTIILAMAGALLSLLTVAVGLALNGRGAASEPQREEQLRLAVASLADAEAACAMQMEQRDWIGRRLATGRRHLERLMTSLAVDRVALQDAASNIWAGVSHPGAPIDPATALHLAREGAVVAARVGSRLNDFDTVTSALFADLETANEVDAMLDDTLAQTEDAIAALREMTEADESDAATTRQFGPPSMPGDPYETNVLEAQRRRPNPLPTRTPAPTPHQTGGYRAVRPESSQHRTIIDRGATGQPPAAGQSQYRRPGGMGASGQHRQPGPAGSSGRHRAPDHPQPPRPPRYTPRPNPNVPPESRDRGSSGSRWLND